MELKPGYKQTEVGVIPEEWSLHPLGSIGKWFSGGTPSMSVEAYWSGDIPWVSPKDMKVPRLHDAIDHITTKAVASGTRLLPVGAILIVTRGMILVHSVPVARAEVALAFNQDIKAVVASKDTDNEFLLYWLAANAECLRGLTTESTHGTKRLPTEMLFRELVACPPIAEQRAIAEALSDADALIESLERLIAKKRSVKQGAMQELLTGKKRLPGFSGEWEVKRLSDIAEIRSGGTPSTAQPSFWDGDILWCTPTDITALKGHKYLSETSRKITVQGLKYSSAEMIPANSIVMTSRATIGECAINTVPVSTNQGFKNFVLFETVDVEFLYYLLTTKKQDFISLCGGSTFLEIGKTQLAIFEIELPSTKNEQTAIAATLSDMDAEIAALEAKLGKARQVKQGMMQELLTGRIRLVDR
jgi:type I restriction enzyme S subunit